MKRQPDSTVEELAGQRAVLSALSDDLALPLMQIKTGLELLGREKFSREIFRTRAAGITLSADAGLQLIEAYRLALKASADNALPLEPVAVGAVLQNVAHQLAPYAKQYDTDLEVEVKGRLTPVLAHKPSLVAALQCLAASLIRAQFAEKKSKDFRLILAARRSADNVIAAGVFSGVTGLGDRSLRTARSLVGKARRPVKGVPAGSASGILIADMLCSAMWQPLRASAHHGMNGLATALPTSKQLHLV